MAFWRRKQSIINYELETAIQHKERINSLYIVYFTQFNIIITYSAILTGIWPYLDKIDPTAGKGFLGYVVGISSLGQMIISPFIGWWSNKLESTRIPFITCLVICILSYVIHINLESIYYHRKYWLLFSRFLAGIGSGCITSCRSHVSTSTCVKERRKAVSMLSSCATLALALGPVIQSMVVPLGDKGIWFLDNKLKLDMYTAIGWIVLILTTINVFLFLPYFFKEYNMIVKESIESREVRKHTYKTNHFKYMAWIFMLLNFIIVFNFMFTKILSTPIAMDEFAMNRSEAIALNCFIMSGSAILSTICILLINPICKYVSEMKVLMFGLFLMIVGRSFFIPWGNSSPLLYDDRNMIEDALNHSSYNMNITQEQIGCPMSQSWCSKGNKLLFSQFILGNVIENIGYSFAITLVMTIFSKVLGSKPQGTWMGLLTAIGSIARVTSPVFISHIYSSLGPLYVSIITNIIFTIILIILFKTAFSLIIPEDSGTKDNIDEEQVDTLIHNKADIKA